MGRSTEQLDIAHDLWAHATLTLFLESWSSRPCPTLKSARRCRYCSSTVFLWRIRHAPEEGYRRGKARSARVDKHVWEKSKGKGREEKDLLIKVVIIGSEPCTLTLPGVEVLWKRRLI